MIEKKGKSSPTKKTGLSHEDEEMWAHVRRSIKPLKNSQTAPQFKTDLTENFNRLLKDSQTSSPQSLSGIKDKVLPTHVTAKPKNVPKDTKTARNELPQFDKQYARKLRRGHLEIEARLDLHGMTQHKAHLALRGFLHSSVAKGKRWVLVITGKGTSAQRGLEDGEVQVSRDTQRGVLKRNVPLWLAEPDLRDLVVSFTEAAGEHGGSGALYVHLRRSSRKET